MSSKDWQLIETAPKDGTKVDLWIKWWVAETDTFAGERWVDCSWYVDRKDWCSYSDRPIGRITHWMPAPEPPNA